MCHCKLFYFQKKVSKLFVCENSFILSIFSLLVCSCSGANCLGHQYSTMCVDIQLAILWFVQEGTTVSVRVFFPRSTKPFSKYATFILYNHWDCVYRLFWSSSRNPDYWIFSSTNSDCRYNDCISLIIYSLMEFPFITHDCCIY